ncbi:MAG: HAD family hydrolase [Candidatus Lokiarchaeota archaeon]|nr:HAD family hydrolase [Candidatus Lokiarchaeota archaeon]
MLDSPILLFDFDGVILTQKALEYTALIKLRLKFYRWQNIDDLRLIDLARIFEQSDSSNRIKALIRVYKNYKNYIPSKWRRIIFFIKFRRMYPKYEKYETIKPNLKEILVKLKEHNVPLGVISNTSRKRLNHFIDKLKLDEFFSVFISRDDTPYRKPDPYPVHLALNLIKKKHNLSIDKTQVYLIGDLPSDIMSANNAKIKSIALLSGHGERISLENAKPTHVLEDISNLLELEPIKKFLLN